MTKEEMKAYQREWYLKNKESAKAKQKAWREANKESIKAKQKAYNDTHKAERKAHYEANKEPLKAQMKVHSKAHYEANKESVLAKHKVYRDQVTNPYRSVVDCPEGYVVHHLNHDHNDNRRTNLLVMTRSDHISYHQFMRHGNYEKASDIIYNYEVF